MANNPTTKQRTAPPAVPSAHAHSIATNPINLLPHDSYTTLRLSHATPEHLHITTRGCFIGPIPAGWLRSHRRDWYKSKVGIHYSSRAATFTASEGTGRQRRVSGLSTGPESRTKPNGKQSPRKSKQETADTKKIGLSFPQPEDVDDDQNHDRSGQEHGEDGPGQPTHQETLEGGEDERHEHTNGRDGSAVVQTDSASKKTPPTDTNGDRQLNPEIESDEDSDDAASIDTLRPGVNSAMNEPSMSAMLSPQRPPHDRMYSHGSSISRNSKGRRTSRTRSLTSVSFVTASEGGASEDEAFEQTAPIPDQEEQDQSDSASILTAVAEERRIKGADKPDALTAEQADGLDTRNPSIGATDLSSAVSQQSQGKVSSTASLISHNNAGPTGGESSKSGGAATSAKFASDLDTDPGKGAVAGAAADDLEASATLSRPDKSAPSHMKRQAGASVHFEVSEDAATRERHVRARIAQLGQSRSLRRLRRSKGQDGQIIKMANMLVKVQFTNFAMPPEYDENDSYKIEAREWDKWKEFMVVCREGDDDAAPFSLQMYSSRVISAVEKANKRKHCRHEISLDKKTTHVNLFSTLDKTMVIWTPYRKGTLVYTMQAKSGADSMEWYTFLRNVLGSARTSVLQINVPDLNINIRLDNVFEKLETARTVAQAAEGDDQAILQTLREERAAAASIIERCMDMMRKSPEWSSLLDAWIGDERIGLAWKRYDRLEWVYGASERKMYGTIAMQKSHELELRPKQHYPTKVKDKTSQDMVEPPPVEGFLVRLTSQRGTDQKLGKLFYKRLYFSTHGSYLVFNRPTKADPPAPPKSKLFDQDHGIPSANEIAEEVPLIFAINPYPLTDAKLIEWLSPGTRMRAEDRRGCDAAAQAESERRLDTVLHSDGLINLCNVVRVRKLHRGATPADEGIGSGGESDVDFDQDVPNTMQDDGVTTSMDDDRTFELVLRNGLVIRLQAYDKTTCKEWMHRLRNLVHYWTLRIRADTNLLKSVRETNLKQLNVDEGNEALIGQFAHKWEVTHSYASPELYHTCSLSRCRSITMSGSLFRKPRTHASFEKELVMLTQGHLVMFRDSLRSKSGSVLKHIHHDRVTALDLRDCYVYSGLATETDLGSAGNTNFEGARPGHNALPRLYPGDGWSSSDEAIMTCFVVWHGRRKSWFRSEQDKERADHHVGLGGASGHAGDTSGKKRQQLKLVRTLGVAGKSVIFMARSRAERDHWVMNIGMEIERLSSGSSVKGGGGQADEVRVKKESD